MPCKHAEIDAEIRRKAAENHKPWQEGDGGVYLNVETPCRECGGKLSLREDFDRWLCKKCLFEDGKSVSVKREPGVCIHCNSELVKQPKSKPTYRCQACFERRLETSRQSIATGKVVSCREMKDRLAQTMGYTNYEDYELSVIREVEQCGTGCSWEKKAAIIKKNRLLRIGSEPSSFTVPPVLEQAPPSQEPFA